MIQLQIYSDQENKVLECAKILLENKLITNPKLISSGQSLLIIEGVLETSRTYWLLAKSKAMLFTRIETLIKKNFPNDEIELFSVPIIHMDWAEMSKLSREVEAI